MAVVIEKRNLCGLLIDGVVSEDHSVNTQVTEHPVANDSPISDHVVPNPLKLTIEGCIGEAVPVYNYVDNEHRSQYLMDAPIVQDSLSSDRDTLLANSGDNSVIADGAAVASTTTLAIANEIGIKTFGTKTTTFVGRQNETGRMGAAWDRIIELSHNGELCTVVSNLKVYDNMVVESALTTQSLENTQQLKFIISLKQVRRVAAEDSTIVQIATKSSKNRGKTNTSGECLQIKDVFSQAPRTDKEVFFDRASGVRIQNKGQKGFISPFNQNMYDTHICGSISDRYKDIRRNARSSQFGQIITDKVNSQKTRYRTRYSFLLPESQVANTASTEDLGLVKVNNVVQDMCQAIRTSDKFCYISGICGDSTFKLPEDEKKQVEQAKRDKVAVDKNPSRATDVQSALRAVNTPNDVIDPIAQYKDNAGVGRIPLLINSKTRLDCYRDNIYDLIAGTIVGGVTLSDAVLADDFSFPVDLKRFRGY